MPTVSEELDVFSGPHKLMKLLIQDIEELFTRNSFTDYDEFLLSLNYIRQRFDMFISHEEIENRYILTPLIPRLDKSATTTLHNDLHSSNRLTDILQQVKCGLETSHGWVRLAEQLKKAIVDFTVDYIPHMNEEEEIYLPLLMKYFTEDELRDLTVKVMELHTLSNRKSRPCSIFSLPPEILLRIFSFLSPKDLCRMSQTHSFFTQLCYDETLWRSIHPIHWANGHWQFFPAINIDKLCHTMLLSNDRLNTALPYRGSNTFDTNELLEKETRIIQGLINHLLPKIGHAVDVIDLSYSTALTSSMASDILMFCMNISHLNLSYADVSDEAFKCFLHQKRSRLQYVNLTGCPLITDVTLYMISWTCSPSLCCSCNDVNSSSIDDNFPHWTTCAVDDVSALKCLILSGCHLITDDGLKNLTVAQHGGFPSLMYLELSGLPCITASSLTGLVTACPKLMPDFLYYCDHINNGPYPDTSNGCQDTAGVHCCRNTYSS